MDDSSDLLSLILQPRQNTEALMDCNSCSSGYGLTLTPEAALRLTMARDTALRQSGRVEFGEGILPKLIYAFCDSPYLYQDEYEAALAELQELFYRFKNETHDRLSDDELISAMVTVFNGRAGGSLEYLASVSPQLLMNGGEAADAETGEDEDE